MTSYCLPDTCKGHAHACLRVVCSTGMCTASRGTRLEAAKGRCDVGGISVAKLQSAGTSH